MPNLSDFEWPCERRDAHHAPTLVPATCLHYPEHVALDTCSAPIPASECPGVEAHPLTMAGGAHR